MFTLYIIITNNSAAVGIYMISHTTFSGTNPQFHHTFRGMLYINMGC